MSYARPLKGRCAPAPGVFMVLRDHNAAFKTNPVHFGSPAEMLRAAAGRVPAIPAML